MIDLSLLMPEFSERLKEFVLEANYQGLVCDVFSAYRTLEEQAHDYALGRTISNPGGIITNAKPGYSWHNWGVAADVVFKDNGKWTWNVPEENWKKLADIADTQGLEWGGSWAGAGKALGDTDHFQLTGGLPIQMAVNLGKMSEIWDEIRRRIC